MKSVIYQNGNYEAIQTGFALETPMYLGGGRYSYAYGGSQPDVAEIRKNGEMLVRIESVTSSVMKVVDSFGYKLGNISMSFEEAVKSQVDEYVQWEREDEELYG